jgi:dipeptidyl aminopeptidase/acylaminoacyl peptidase
MYHSPRSVGWVAALVVGAAAVFSSGTLAHAQTRPMELEDLFRLKRVSDPQLSPDGTRVAYVVTEVLKEENRTNADIWLVNIDGTGEPRKLTNSPKRDAHPRWSPDGKWIAFESTRDGEGQIWLLPVEGGEPRKATTLSTGAGQAAWSPDGKALLFVSSVFPEFSAKPFKESDKLNKEKQEARDKSKVKARLFTKLLYRHWDSWVEDKRQHLFVVPIAADGVAGEPRDVTPGENDAVPTSSTFATGDDFTFSPDGTEVVFAAPPEILREQAWSTNHDLWSVNLKTGERRNLTKDNPAADGFPRFSPDGRYLAYKAQARAGFEADKWQVWLVDLKGGAKRSLTGAWDRSVGAFTWAPDSKSIYLEAQENGTEPVWQIGVDGAVRPAKLTDGGVATDGALSVKGDLVYLQQKLTQPAEVMVLRAKDPQPRALTRTNAETLAKVALATPESVTVPGAGGTPVQLWIVKPPGFDPAKKYPLVFWVHGGPQSAFLDSWSTRWNSQVWAAQGYVVTMANPRGSTGFGQKFTDEISHDWGGKVYEDLLACLAYVEKQPYINTTRMAAAGASYGGYMMNWFNGHLDKFKCIVNHDGVYNFDSMYGTTEEVWFDEWEHGKPWENADDYAKFSPHRYAANFKTPTLIIHNELDFRVPIGEGQALFTTLQRKGIDSKFLSFPDEGHWVLKPQNSELWHKTIFEWLEGYLKK